MRSLSRFIMKGRSQSVLIVAVCALLSYLLPPFSLLSVAALTLVTLRKGNWYGLQILAGALLATALLGQLTLGTPLVAISYLGVLWLPTWLLAMVLRSTLSLATTLEVAALLGAVAVVAIYAVLGDPVLWWQSLLEVALVPFLGTSSGMADFDVSGMIAEMAPKMTGLMVAASLSNLMLGLVLGRVWQSKLYNPGGFQREFHALRLHRQPAIGAALLLAATLGATHGIVADLEGTLLLLFAVAGLAVVHAVVARRGLHVMWLVGIYVVLMITAKEGLVALGLIGFTNVWFDLAKRLGGPKTV